MVIPSAAEVGAKIVSLSNTHQGLEAVDTLYDEKIVSIESQGSDAMPARIEGMEAVRGKSEWWYENHDVHDVRATGPFCGHRDDQFVVHYHVDVTFKPTGERHRMEEVGLYTVRNGKVVQEEFMPLVSLA